MKKLLTAAVLVAVVGPVAADKPQDGEVAKPLTMQDVFDAEARFKKETARTPTTNPIAAQQWFQDKAKEMNDRVRGKVVEDEAKIASMTLVEGELWLTMNTADGKVFNAYATDIKDPALAKIQVGQTVRFKGIVNQKHGSIGPTKDTSFNVDDFKVK